MVETSGGGGDKEVLAYMSHFAAALGANSVGEIGSNMAGIRVFPDEENLYAKARTLGQELCQSIKDKRVYCPPQQRKAFARQMGILLT